MRYISLFSGIGGFEKGIQESKYKNKLICTHYSEIDKYAESIYRRQFPSETIDGTKTHQALGDITKVKTSDLPDFDLLVGGFPCQAFSVAGLQGGFNDTRGTLFFEIARVLKDKRPRYFLLENVKGLLGHDKGKTFQTILEVLSGLGYDVKWEILNSKEFGVPQNRERIFIKGYSRTECRGEVLPFRKTSPKIDGKLNTLNKNKKVHQGNAVYDSDGLACTQTSNTGNLGRTTGLYKVNKLNNKSQAQIVYDSNGLSCTLSANGGGQGGKTGLYKINKVGNFSPSNHHGKNIYSADGISPTLCSGSVKKNGLNIMTSDELPTFKKLEDGRSVTTTKNGDCFCLTTSQQIDKLKKRKSNFVIEKVDSEPKYFKNYSIRRLTPVECERLQGFPDNWTRYGEDGEKISDTQRYKCCGNAVTVNVIRHIFDNWDLNM